MFGTSVIVFREVLEAALIIGIVAAATRDVPNRTRWLLAGLFAGLAGSAIVAASTEAIAEIANGIGQELFNAIILGIAVTMLAWHNIWMAAHGRELANHAQNVGSDIREGRSERSILLAVVGLAVLREGSETVLFLYGIAATEETGSLSMLLGGLIGIAAGISVGYAVFAGLLRVPMRWFFTATGLMVLLLASGMASQAARYLIQADLMPALSAPLWDSSSVLPEHSLLGMLLHTLVGYDARPAGMQVIFYIATFTLISFGMKWSRQKPYTPSKEI